MFPAPGIHRTALITHRSRRKPAHLIMPRFDIFSFEDCGITGSFHSVSKTHLHRYCDEFSFRWNERKVTDGERTVKALGMIQGARLMYKEPIRRRS